MSIDWRDPNCSLPNIESYVVVRYSNTRSDIPFTYLVSLYDGKWKQEYMVAGKFMLLELPKPNSWGYIETQAEEEHG
jgi:hypothetical protein